MLWLSMCKGISPKHMSDTRKVLKIHWREDGDRLQFLHLVLVTFIEHLQYVKHSSRNSWVSLFTYSFIHSLSVHLASLLFHLHMWFHLSTVSSESYYSPKYSLRAKGCTYHQQLSQYICYLNLTGNLLYLFHMVYKRISATTQEENSPVALSVGWSDSHHLRFT